MFGKNKKAQHAQCQSHIDSRISKFEKNVVNKIKQSFNDSYRNANKRMKEVEDCNAVLQAKLAKIEEYLKIELVEEYTLGYKKVTKKK